ncbi:tape measure protein [Nitrobacter winogradskyi]|uniref:Tape measure domain-containing protein n=2 Tax=Nitrobacter winogradskyi TaxID=913 RepID=A0ACC6AF79_NITWI|nr:tape measure protein [Nitrobacter winogradskyi]MCP1998261.1 tape measure domain-containing protein [Nitrobacter winogradskyi]GEC15152.1 phage tape measure protein [Nitrobacter winogradskyi]
MAQDLEQMVLSISADTRQIQRALKKLEADSRASTKNIEKQFDGLGKKVSGSFAGLGKGMVGALAAAFSLREAQKFIDTATRIDNALKVAGLSGEQLTKVYDALFVSAQKNAAPLEALVQLYGRASLVQKELGVSTEQLLKFTDNVAVALRVSGKSAAESSGALLQLSQALGSGVVRAEEFNSMLEGALPIVQAAANGITEAGGSVSKLRQLVVDGKVSSAAFFKGFQAGAVMLNQQVAGASLTVAQGFERLQNSAVDAARRINDASGASRAATSALDTLSAAVTKLADAFTSLASSKSLQDTNRGLDALGAAAQNLWNDPSFQNLYRFLFDTSGSLAQRAAGDAIASRAEGFNALRKAMSAANAEADKAAAKKSTASSRFDDAFSPFATKKVSLADNPVTAAAKKGGGAGSDRDTFERRLAMTQRQIDLMGVEASTIDQTATARERARVVVELETAAREANHRAGKSNTEVTEAQRAKINELADAYAKARGQLEQLNGPLATFARESSNIGQQLEYVAVQSLDRMSDELADVITGTRSVADAFKSMSNLILHELARIAIKKAILGPIAGMLGGGGGSSILSAIPKFANGTNFAPGGMAIVGERGPELVNLPRGSEVVPNYRLPKPGRSAPTQTFAPVYQIDARGADAGAVDRIRGVLAQHAKAIAGQSRAMQSAQRFQSTGVA